MTARRNGTHLFGWCITGHHADCPSTLTLSETRREVACLCDCHTTKDSK